jgi:hypothetical protein
MYPTVTMTAAAAPPRRTPRMANVAAVVATIDLNDNREEDLAVGEVVANTVKDSPVGKEGNPTAANLAQQLLCPPDIKIRILLSGK